MNEARIENCFVCLVIALSTGLFRGNDVVVLGQLHSLSTELLIIHVEIRFNEEDGA